MSTTRDERKQLFELKNKIEIAIKNNENDKIVYRPSVMFLYLPCHYAQEYFISSKVNDYPNPNPTKPLDCENENEIIKKKNN